MKPRHATTLAFVVLGLWLALPANSESAPLIARIEVRGNHRISERAIREHISSQAGQPLDIGIVDRDIKTLYQMGGFKTVKAFVRREPNENILVIAVDETPAR